LSQLILNTLPPFTFCTTGPTNNTWESIGPNPIYQQNLQHIGLLFCLAVNPNDTNEIYVGAGDLGGIYKTNNHGQDWVNLTDKYLKPGLGIRSIQIKPTNSNHVLAGAYTKIYGSLPASHCNAPLKIRTKLYSSIIYNFVHYEQEENLYTG
jgi:hypothetical protein